MTTENIEKMSGHWLLAKIGKKVLRPGGKELTEKMLSMLNISNQDSVVEFAPGLGFTAALTLSKYPKSYTGINADEKAVQFLNRKFNSKKIKFYLGNAASTHIENQSVNKVYGEAMLTMHANHRKSEIVKEAHRILEKDGLYAIHELALFPNDLDENVKSFIQKDLAKSIKVNARPLTISEWKQILENEGFKIIKIEISPMHLLEPKRIIEDEKFLGFLKIVKNLIIKPELRKRVFQMQKTFRKYNQNLGAISILAQKNNQ